MQIVLYQRTGPVPGGIGSLVRIVEPDGESVDIGVFSPWPSSLGSNDRFMCLVPGSAGNRDEWLTPAKVEVRTSPLNARASDTVGLVSFSKAPSRGDVPTSTPPQRDEAPIAHLLEDYGGSWRKVLFDLAPPEALTSSTDRPAARASAAAAAAMPNEAPRFDEVHSNTLTADRSLLCIILGRRD
jgi:hypothetical protein